MGYRCPVCGDPQADGHHLANHLAFTAMLGDGGHEAWLDDHAPGWVDADPAELAGTVTDHAEETEFPQVFEDTTSEQSHAHDHDHGESPITGLDGVGPGDVDPSSLFDGAGRDTEDILAEAREMTRRQRMDAVEDEPDSDEDADSRDTDETRGS